MPENCKVFYINDFIDGSLSAALLHFAKNTDLWYTASKNKHPWWKGRSISHRVMPNFLQHALREVSNKLQHEIMTRHGLTKMIYPDTFSLSRWYPGMDQIPHSDNMQDTKSAPNHEHRQYGAVIYLNDDDYTGGETFYENFNFMIRPVANTVVCHPADVLHRHGVNTVYGNIRYTLSTFWTFDTSRNTFK
mgnify:FL=1